MSYAILTDIKDALDGIAGVATCKIGLEQGISPADYPILRIVPTKREHGAALGRTKLRILVYFGAATAEADQGLEEVYEQLDTLEAALITALETPSEPFTAIWQGTTYDGDTLEGGYKVAAAEFTVVG